MCTTTPAASLLETDPAAEAKAAANLAAQSEAMAGMKAKAKAAGKMRVRQEEI